MSFLFGRRMNLSKDKMSPENIADAVFKKAVSIKTTMQIFIWLSFALSLGAVICNLAAYNYDNLHNIFEHYATQVFIFKNISIILVLIPLTIITAKLFTDLLAPKKARKKGFGWVNVISGYGMYVTLISGLCIIVGLGSLGCDFYSFIAYIGLWTTPAYAWMFGFSVAHVVIDMVFLFFICIYGIIGATIGKAQEQNIPLSDGMNGDTDYDRLRENVSQIIES